jgi:hypothetical protein
VDKKDERMKNIGILLIGLMLVFSTACSDDDPQPAGDNVINYDGPNDTAPTLASGFYEFGVRFTNRELSGSVGKSITEISFYMYDVLPRVTVTFSPDFTISEPAEIQYSEDVTNLTANAWNTFQLQTPFPIDGNPLWIGVKVDLPQAMQTIGCDAGPANANGDWLYSDEPPTWDTFRALNNVSVNWNIRATISE